MSGKPADSGTTTSKAITGDTTFTGTAVSPTGHTVTCTAVVTVQHGGGGGGPSCTMTVSPTSIRSGNSATLTWGGSDIMNVDIDNSIATGTTSPGSTTVAPTGVGTHTYTGTFHANDGETLTCSATLNVEGGSGGCTSNCGGGGGQTPTITLFSHPSTQPLAYLYLSQIPYTGLDLGPLGTVLYWFALIAWSFALAYLALFGALPYAQEKARGFGMRVAVALNAPAPEQERAPAPPPVMQRAHAPAPPKPSMPTQAPPNYSRYEGFRSFAQGSALTIDDIVKGLSRAKQVPPAPHTEPIYTDVEPVYDHVEPIEDKVEPIYENVEPIRDNVEPIMASAPAAPAPEVPNFLEALIAGDRTKVFGMLRDTIRGGGDAETFLTQIACALDDAYRARLEKTPVHPEVERICKDCATPVLERLVTSLASAVDSSYSIGITGAKLALTRALATLGA